MAQPKFAFSRDPKEDPARLDAHREAVLSPLEEQRRTERQSGKIQIDRSPFFPENVRCLTMDIIGSIFEEAFGYYYDFDRVIGSFGRERKAFPRRLIGPLLIELSKHLHPGRRPDFLRMACETLHELEGTPRVLS